MAQLTVLMAGLLFLVESQASDVADRSTFQGFLSKYVPSGSDAPRSSLSDYDKFITPNLNRVKHGNGAKDFNSPAIADRQEIQALQEPVTIGSSSPITLSAIGIGLLSLVTMLGVRLQRGLQPATALASSGGLGPLMPVNTASALGDNVMEMQSQDPNLNHGAAVLGTRPALKVKSNRVGWGQLSSQNSRPRTLCYGLLDDLLGAALGGGGGELIAPERALPGRKEPMPNIDGSRHFVLGTDQVKVPEGHKVAVFANGCFWGSEKGIWRFPYGIYSTAVGYCAGFTPNPNYNEACSGMSGHTEGVRVVYDPAVISFADILRWFWEAHDPTSGMGQGNDRGTQYRSGFYYFDEDQKRLIEASKAFYEAKLGRPITTEVAAAADYDQYGGLWFFAEQYHQQYLAKPGARPYCSAQPQGIDMAPFTEWCPADLQEAFAPKLPDVFWDREKPRRGCSVVNSSNEPVVL